MPGGDLYEGDFDRLIDSVDRVIRRFPDCWLHFAEVGVGLSQTSRDLMEHIGQTIGHQHWVYYGIDAIHKPADMPQNYHHLGMPSHKAVVLIPRLEWVYVDACHCVHCCMRDMILYSNLLVSGGEIAVHDASPAMQGQDRQNWPGCDRYHDAGRAEREGVQVRRVLDSGMLPQLKLILPAQAENQRGGTEVLEKT